MNKALRKLWSKRSNDVKSTGEARLAHGQSGYNDDVVSDGALLASPLGDIGVVSLHKPEPAVNAQVNAHSEESTILTERLIQVSSCLNHFPVLPE